MARVLMFFLASVCDAGLGVECRAREGELLWMEGASYPRANRPSVISGGPMIEFGVVGEGD